jgi:hypothetical protein
MSPSIELVIDDNSNWAHHEFKTADFSDKRLNKRLIKIANDFANKPDCSIPKATGSWAAAKATYNFFNNERVCDKTMLSSHIKSTIDRIAHQDVVLCVQDTTSLNFTTHPDTKGLGTLSSQGDKTIGIMVHDTMAFTPQGVALGLIDLQTWTRPKEEYGKRRNRKNKPIHEKESNKWLKSYQATQEIQAQLSQTTLVNIADRESDIYELFERATKDENGDQLLVRARHNRIVDHPEKYLWDFVASQKVSGMLTVEVPRQKKKPKRNAELSIRFAKVTLKRPDNIATPNMPESITVWAILAEEIKPPKKVEPIRWLLLTTIPINSFDEAVEKVQWYTIRWLIELFHKVLKSGCKTEDRQLQTAEKLIKCLAIDAIIAWRILLLTRLGREVPNLPCSVVFEEYEWKALYRFVHQTTQLPDKEPTLQETIRMVAKLGGFLGRKGDGEPGSMTIWRGMTRLRDIANSYIIFSPKSPPPLLMGKD